MTFLYDLFIWLYLAAIRIAAWWHPKAGEWISGRKHLFTELKKVVSDQDKIVWIHSASAGEFEQAKPIIEALKKQFSTYKILASFYSPSGYNAASSYPHTDHIFYLPVDTRSNAERLLETIHPSLIIFIKYDFWYHHLKTAHSRKIPLLLVSAVFRNTQPFFRWYGSFHKRMLHFFQHIFVQDESSLDLLKAYGIAHCSISGDTRFDRVAGIASGRSDLTVIQQFMNQELLLIAGSTWPEDERLISTLPEKFKNLKFILVPHELGESHLRQIKTTFLKSLLYSEADESNIRNVNVLIMDRMGLLSKLYRYATIAYVGGGFSKDGIHNVLEAAVFGKPVIIGPNFRKYREAIELISKGGAFSFSKEQELEALCRKLLENREEYEKSANASAEYVLRNTGATNRILSYVQEKRLLIN